MDNLTTDGDVIADTPETAGRESGAETQFPDELLYQLLGESPAAQPGQPEGDAATPETAPKLTLKQLAERSGLQPEQLYQLSVPLPEEQGSVTLGELKDEAHKYRKGKAQRAEDELSRTEFANQKLQYLNELQQAVAALPAEYLQDQDKLAPVAQFLQTQQAQQDRLLLEVLPRWQDAAVRDQDVEHIRQFLAAEYGAPTASWDQPAPAWVRKLIYDHWQLAERMKAISTKRKVPKAATPARPSDAAGRKRAALARGDKLDAMAQVLLGRQE